MSVRALCCLLAVIGCTTSSAPDAAAPGPAAPAVASPAPGPAAPAPAVTSPAPASAAATPAPPPAPATPTPAPAPCGKFDHFRMYHGNPLEGIDVLELDAAGAATYFVTLHEEKKGVLHMVTRELRFTVAPDVLAALQAELDAIAFCELDPKYTADMHDGLQQSYSLWHGDRRTRVYCDNLFPPPIQRLRGFLRDRVLPTEAAAKKAPRAGQAAFEAAIRRAE